MVVSDFEFRSSLKIVRTLRNIGDITVRSSLIDYNFKTSPTLLTSQAKLVAGISDAKDNFYTSSRGVNECNVVVSGNLAELKASTICCWLLVSIFGVFALAFDSLDLKLNFEVIDSTHFKNEA